MGMWLDQGLNAKDHEKHGEILQFFLGAYTFSIVYSVPIVLSKSPNS
jgi:hypothetical protein